MLKFRVHGAENASTSDALPVSSVHSPSLAQGKFGPKGMHTLFYLVQRPARTALLGIASKESVSYPVTLETAGTGH